MAKQYRFLGVKVDDVSFDDVIQRIDQAVSNKRPLNIVTINPELVMIAQKDEAFKAAVEYADIVTPDGVGLLITGKLTKRPLKQRVTGSDLCVRLAKETGNRNWRIYLLGSKPGVAQKAAKQLEKDYPGVQIVGANSADPDDASAPAILKDVEQTNPHIVLVAYGSPKQELWIQKYKSDLGSRVLIGVGGSLDFIAGNVKRAPHWVQRIGLEWLWRLILQPWRLKRVLVLPHFAVKALTERQTR